MQKVCQTCNKDFEIRDEDVNFYEQVKTVPPLHCPDCRAMRRLAFRNERTFYKRSCDLCKKDMISLYTANSPYTVYCNECWWSDKWDPKSFAQDFDPNKNFFEQYRELQKKVPRLSLMNLNAVRTDYANGTSDNKDCYLIFAGEYNEDCMYSRLIQKCKGSVDCAFVHICELCYECIDVRECFKCMYCEQCQSSTDLIFCYNMRNSNNCIFCTNGRNISNAILNVKYSQEEYEKKKAEIFSSYETIEQAKKEFADLKSKTMVKYASATKCHNVTGDYMHNCHDGVRVFDSTGTKNCSYLADAEEVIDSMDCNNFYYKNELCYNMMGVLQSSKCKNGAFIFYSNEVEYSENCHNLTSAIGCNAIRKGQYMILNKEYSKEDYYKIKEQIDEQMKKDGTYGQFFPPKLAPFGFNETLGQDYYPLTKTEAEEKSFNWQEQTTGTYGKETIKEKDVPQTITAVTDGILQEILVCKDCKKNFRITKGELDFYKRMNLPLPHKDFECRHKDRMSKRNPRKLWHRSCMCGLKSHVHGAEKCENEFETSYSPDRPEIVYCETCYQQEVS
ncbi:hypothetical protein A2917_03205 [Candidatus Nomurabacteria bacterium RIFCSPLOWO2_01_FULL_42_17]|uniref:Zinc-binding domain-containing protein n=1 Tax=Candidatus Nomurabacteria bacterium RIFCSPLOWO2_01_FULL_42_17 TaxID=1801780 RepID=A0A1F6XN62_9BACT|nr:MAG: hypothetical protein A2917_03205 [Candidatus Nomurabacteria bacterium RIFCSPLOWO2_01_FULL_42_17]